MKREILCITCSKDTKKLFPNENPFPGEHVKFVDGKAIKDFICDACGSGISDGEDCTAFSCWADYGGIPYFEWEKDFLKTENNECFHCGRAFSGGGFVIGDIDYPADRFFCSNECSTASFDSWRDERFKPVSGEEIY